ncbi:response regulator, partial [Arhodomonas sp. KWT]
RESETLLLQQSRVNTELQDGLMRTRMVPFVNLVPRLRRIVRQAGRELGRQVELQVRGGEGEMDRSVLERMVPPLEHMLRNAVAHGIEPPEQRRREGKPEAGTITIEVAREGADVVLWLGDDGGGMNLEAISRRAVEKGLMTEGAALTQREIMQFVLEPGFSTASRVTQVAGRGVGLDVANAEIRQLGGSLEIDSREGEGTRFTVRLPFTLALNQGLLCQVGDETYAIPLSSIVGVVRAERSFLAGALASDEPVYYEYAGAQYEVVSLGGLLGAGTGVPDEGRALAPLVLVRAGEHAVALQVDTLLGSRDIVVKSPGPQVSTIPGIFGATILADGRVVLILDVGALMRYRGRFLEGETQRSAPAPRRERALVMVVDDSITMRKVATRLLERNGMEVITAKDGLDAVARLQEQTPDAVLLDIEMPRMDGYEFAAHMRNQPETRETPIIMITSRTGEKHRQRAMDTGVDRYLGKPYQETELLEALQELLETGRAPV